MVIAYYVTEENARDGARVRPGHIRPYKMW